MKPQYGSKKGSNLGSGSQQLRGSGLLFFVIGLIAFSPLFAMAQATPFSIPEIFDMRKNLPLEPTEPVFHDFYINAGPEAGFKKGMYATVVRQVPIHDPVQNKQQAMLNVEVARIKIVHVQKNLTVARVHSILGDDERPTLEFESIMIGDRIDPTTLSMEEPGKKSPAKRSALLMQDSTPTVLSQPVAPMNQGVAAVSSVAPPTNGSVQSIQPLNQAKNPSTNAIVPDMVRVPVPGAAKTL
jgi:hypothetical protein